MKKIITGLLLLFAVYGAKAQDTSRTQYSYYPGYNIYYNDANKQYSYYDSTMSNWIWSGDLPSKYQIDPKTPKNTIYYNGTDVWKDNTAHVKKYGTKVKPPMHN